MGHMVEEMARQKGWEILAALSSSDAGELQTLEKADVAVDFSHPAMLEPLAAYIRRTGTPLVSGTTGYSEEQMDSLRQLGESAAILYSANYSLGVALFRQILEKFGPALLANFDVELVEKHHNQKMDAPSGTAKMLANALDPEQQLRRVSGREGLCGARGRDEMGMFAVRGRYSSRRAHAVLLRRRRDPFDHPQRRQPPDFCRRCGESGGIDDRQEPGILFLGRYSVFPVISTERMG